MMRNDDMELIIKLRSDIESKKEKPDLKTIYKAAVASIICTSKNEEEKG